MLEAKEKLLANVRVMRDKTRKECETALTMHAAKRQMQGADERTYSAAKRVALYKEAIFNNISDSL